MTEAEWLACADPTPMLTFLGRTASDRKLRLAGCGCCRRAWHLIPDDPTRQIVEAVERFVEGHESAVTIGRLRKRATRSYNTRYLHPYHLAVRKASAQSTTMLLQGVMFFLSWTEQWGIRYELCPEEAAAQSSIIRDVFGNPFRSVTTNPKWRTFTAVGLAEGIYADRAFDRLPILADALEEAGCESEDVLSHCRGLGPHVRGCWVVDLILGKE